jgi:hypothetical protein
VLEGSFTVQATEPDLPPVEVPSAILNPGTLPEASTEEGSPVLDGIDGPTTFINGSTLTYRPAVTPGGEPITGVAVSVDGYDGWWLLPVPEDWDGELPLLFPNDIFDRLDGARAPVTVIVAMLDAASRFSNAISLTIQGLLVGTGDVQVGIVWDTPTDVDLHVTEPGGETIYYGNLQSSAGGTLDLDSNPACNIDGVNAENIFWPGLEGTNDSEGLRGNVIGLHELSYDFAAVASCR